MRERTERHRLLTIFLVVFVDLLGFSLILPLLPYYAEAYGANELTVGLLTASYAAAQLIGAPLLGRLSDQHGRRPILLVSIAGTAFGFLLLGVAEALGRSIGVAFFGANLVAINGLILGLLFTSRILDGLTGGNISVAQAYISDVTPPEDRGRAFGLIGAAFGLGFIIGPVIGGLLAERFGYAAPAFVAMTIATVNLIAVYLYLPESLTPEARAEMTSRPRPAFNLNSLITALQRPRVGPLFLWHGVFDVSVDLCTLRRRLSAQPLGRTDGAGAWLCRCVVCVGAGVCHWPVDQTLQRQTVDVRCIAHHGGLAAVVGIGAECVDAADHYGAAGVWRRRAQYSDQQRAEQVGPPGGNRRHVGHLGVAGEPDPRDCAGVGRAAAVAGATVGAGAVHKHHDGVGGIVYLATTFYQPRSAAGAARRRIGCDAAAWCGSRTLRNV